LSLSAPLALALALAAAWFLRATRPGYRFRLAGADPAFARFGGIDAGAYCVPAMAASGGLFALAGFFAAAGTYGLCHQGFPGGLGWSAIAVSLVARSDPLALIPAALIFAGLKAGSDAALLQAGLSLESAALIQAAALVLAVLWKPGPLPRRRRV